MRPPGEIEIIKGNIIFELEKELSQLSSSSFNDVDGEAFFNVCLNYRKLAICGLLLEADTDYFFHQLFKSGQAYLSFLSLSRKGPVKDKYYLCTGRAEALWDTVAANDVETAKKIASLSRNAWDNENEYEDEFCYFYFLMRLLTVDENSESQLDLILERYENALQGVDSYRLDMCQALLKRNGKKFHSSLERLIEKRNEEIQQERVSGLPSDPEILETEAHIFIEGIALVRLAKLRGIEVREEYKSIPCLAMASMESPFPSPESWKSIEGG